VVGQAFENSLLFFQRGNHGFPFSHTASFLALTSSMRNIFSFVLFAECYGLVFIFTIRMTGDDDGGGCGGGRPTGAFHDFFAEWMDAVERPKTVARRARNAPFQTWFANDWLLLCCLMVLVCQIHQAW